MKITDGTAEFEIKELDRLTITGIEGKTDLHSALHRYGDNPTDLKGLTNEQWHNKGTFISYFSKPDLIENQPSTYGQLINLIPTNDKSIEGYNQEIMQIWVQHASGDIWTRGGSVSSPISSKVFTKIYNSANSIVVIDNHISGSGEGWREWSNGLLEQWCWFYIEKNDRTITFLRPFKNNTYMITNSQSSASDGAPLTVYDLTPSTLTVKNGNTKTSIIYLYMIGEKQ